MADDYIDSLYGSGIYAPYSREEEGEALDLSSLPVKAALDRARHQYVTLIHLVDGWRDYAAGNGPKPKDEPIRFLFPGRNAENHELDCYEEISRFFSGFAHGATPHITELYNAAKTCLSFLRRLDDIKPTDHLRNAWRHFTDFIRLLDYRGEPRMLHDEFTRRISETSASFLRERTANAIELGAYLSGQPCSAQKKLDDASPTLLRLRIRLKAVSLVKGYMRKTSCNTSEAVRKVHAVLWKDFHRLGLRCGTNNFSILLYKPKYRDSPPADDSDLRSACLDFGG